MATIKVGDTVNVPKGAGVVTLSNPAVASIAADATTGKSVITGTAKGWTAVVGERVIGIVIVNDGTEPRLAKLPLG